MLDCTVFTPDSPTLQQRTGNLVEVANTPVSPTLIRPSKGDGWSVNVTVPGIGVACVDIGGDQLAGALREGVLPGGRLRGDWVWVRLGNRQHLVRVGSEQHTIAASQTRQPHRKPLRASELVPGRSYLDAQGYAYLYLGEVATVCATARDTRGGGAPWDVQRFRGPAFLELRHTLFAVTSDPVALESFRNVASHLFRLHFTPRPAAFYAVAPVHPVSPEDAVAFARDVLLAPDDDYDRPPWMLEAMLTQANKYLLRSTSTDPHRSPVDPKVFRDLARAYASVSRDPVPVELATDPLLA